MSDPVDFVVVRNDRDSRLATIGAIAVELVAREDSLGKVIKCEESMGFGFAQNEAIAAAQFRLDEIKRLLRSEVVELKKRDGANGGAF